MKTFYGISLFLLCFIVSYGDAFAAVDVTIKTSLMRTVTQTIITGASSGSCGNAAPEPDTLNFEIKVVDSVTTQFTVRVVEKEDTSTVILGPSTHAIVNGGNYNRANGELTHTVTGIPSSKKPLLLQLFKGGSASGTPYVEQEVSSARGTKVQSGVLTIGDIGNFDNSLGSAGGVVTGGSKSSDGSSSEITVNIETQEDANYVVMVTIDSQTNGSRQENSQIRTPVVYDKQSSSFKVYLNDPIGSTQNIRLNVMIQGYQ